MQYKSTYIHAYNIHFYNLYIINHLNVEFVNSYILNSDKICNLIYLKIVENYLLYLDTLPQTYTAILYC